MTKMQRAALALFAAILAYYYSHDNAAGSEKIPLVEDSIKFLLDCAALKKQYPAAYAQLDGLTPFVYYTTVKNDDSCAQYYAGIIVLYPPAFSVDCAGGNTSIIIAHEILHQVGLPPHKIHPKTEADWVKYLRTDPIEKIMAECGGGR